MKDDSRKVNVGDTFVSLDGNKKYICDAIINGASKIVCDNLEVINTNPREYLANYLDELYKDFLFEIWEDNNNELVPVRFVIAFDTEKKHVDLLIKKLKELL